MTAIPAGEVGDEGSQPTRRWSRGSTLRFLGLGIGTCLLALLFYGASVHSFNGNSDGATVVLEGQAMSAGNVALHGWSMTLESFWSIDAVVYAIIIRLIGLHRELLHLIPALIATLVVLAGVYLAAEGRQRLHALIGGGVIVALLALPSPDLAFFFLSGPLHICTALWCLLAFIGLSRGGFGWGWILAVCLLGAGLLGDFMIASLGVIPVLLCGVLLSLYHRNWRSGSSPWLAASASVVLAVVIRVVAMAFGTFTFANRSFPVSLSQIGWNARHVPVLVAHLLGVGSLPIGISGGPLFDQSVHAFGIVVCLVGVISALVEVVLAALWPKRVAKITEHDLRLDSLLLFAFVGDLVTFIVFSPTAQPANVRYLTPGVIIAVVLAGRMVSRHIAMKLGDRKVRVALVVLSLVVVVFGFDVASYVARPLGRQPAARLAMFLEQHHLTQGVGDYWSASIVTVESDGAVTVRPLTADLPGRLYRDDRQSSAAWYAGQPFQFFVYDTKHLVRYVNARSAIAMFGRPIRAYRVGIYRVLVWSQPMVFSANLPSQPGLLNFDWNL